MPDLDKQLAEIVAKLAALAAQHGSEAIGLLGTVYQLQAIGALLSFIPPAVFTAVVVIVLRRLAPPVVAEWRKDIMKQNEALLFPGTIGGGLLAIGGIISFVSALFCASNLISPLIWAAAFDARIAIAARVLKAF